MAESRITKVLKRQTRLLVLIGLGAALIGGAVGLQELLRAAPEPPDRGKASEPEAGESGEPEHTNALIDENSPYLRMHAHNPVDWHPWGPEAFEKAKKQDKPIFLSVGYSTCYWCQVMERESFTNPEIAAILNEHYVPVKVDRERRPDIDEKYMLATRLITGQGGWPNSVWLTPDGRPWMAGTYFPPEQFTQALNRLAEVWANQRQQVEQQADRLAQAIRRAGTGGMMQGQQGQQASHPLNEELIEQAVEGYRDSFDATHGGFDGAPKFPPHGALRILTHRYRSTGDEQLLEMIGTTLDAMWLGGVRDHLGGGFHRYSTDSEWLLPHFEKMLYDNAQLLRAYTDGYLLTERPSYRRAVEAIFFWLNRKMIDKRGRFLSAIDAEVDGEEGRSYVWHDSEILDVLGEEDGELFAEVYGVEEGGNYTEERSGERTGANVLHLEKPLAEIAEERGVDPAQFRERLAAMRKKLLAERDTWKQPEIDDKTVAAWNGMMIGSLAYAGRKLEEPRYTEAAEAAADFILGSMRPDGQLMRTYRGEQTDQPAFLDDYAHLAHGLLELYRTTGHPRWLSEAERLAETMLAEFEDEQDGGFFFTTEDHENVLGRSKRLQGSGNVPTANGVAAEVLLELGRGTENPRYTEAAVRTLESLSGVMGGSPRAVEALVYAAGMHLDPVSEEVEQTPSVAGSSETGQTEKAEDLPEPDAVHANPPVTARAYASRQSVKPGQSFEVAVALDIEEGWHLYGPNPEIEFVLPTALSLAEGTALKAGEAEAPEGRTKQDPVLGEELTTYEGRVWFRLPVTVPEDAEPSETVLKLDLKTQACDARRCLPPRQTELSLPITIDPQAKTDGEARHPEVFSERAGSGG